MRLGECRFAPDLPAFSQISIWHPGYLRGEDTMFTLPRLDPVGTHSDTDAEPGHVEWYGVHFKTMLLACQIVTGNSFDLAYLSYDLEGQQRVRLSCCGILMRAHYYLHIPQEDGTDTYPVTPSFQHWRFPETLPEPWKSLTPSRHDHRPSCIITGSQLSESAQVIPEAYDQWWTDNTMGDYSVGAKPIPNSEDNILRLRADLHKVFDDRTFAIVPKPDDHGYRHLVVHFFAANTKIGSTALDVHNRKVHSLDLVAIQFLFARFALAVFARIKDFMLRGKNRKVAIVERGTDARGRPALVTRVVNMDRAQRQTLYEGDEGRDATPSEPPDRGNELNENEWEGGEEENGQGQLLLRSSLEAHTAQLEDDESREAKRRRTSERWSPPSLPTPESPGVILARMYGLDGSPAAGPRSYFETSMPGYGYLGGL